MRGIYRGSFFAFSVGGGWLAVYIGGVDRIIITLGSPDNMDVWCIYGSNMWLLDIMKNKLTIIILYSEAAYFAGVMAKSWVTWVR